MVKGQNEKNSDVNDIKNENKDHQGKTTATERSTRNRHIHSSRTPKKSQKCQRTHVRKGRVIPITI
jgi:hypothetical protein